MNGGPAARGTAGPGAEPRGVVVNIQHFSTHDGPGIRTSVFLKGCTLRCAWCCNPETIAPAPQLAYNAAQCGGRDDCGWCADACPRAAISFDAGDGKVRVRRSGCDDCLRCVAACPSTALHAYGRMMTVSEVLAEVEQDDAFHRESGGGLTVTGGECLMQPEFTAALLRQARQRGIHTAIETAGNVAWDAMEMVLPHVDLVLHDHKFSDPEAHRRWTGAGNQRLRANFRQAYQRFPGTAFIARIPLIAGLNDDAAHVLEVLDFILPYPNVVDLELLPYHDFGTKKYAFIERPDGGGQQFAAPPPERVRHLRALIERAFAARAQGLTSAAGGRASPL